MRKLIVALGLFIGTLAMDAQNIGHIEQQGSWYYIYNQAGKKTHTLSASSGVLAGYSSTMFILRNGSWYYIYNAEGRKEKTLSASTVGDILNVTGDTFTSRHGTWIYTWSRDGRKINTRAAR